MLPDKKNNYRCCSNVDNIDHTDCVVPVMDYAEKTVRAYLMKAGVPASVWEVIELIILARTENDETKMLVLLSEILTMLAKLEK